MGVTEGGSLNWGCWEGGACHVEGCTGVGQTPGVQAGLTVLPPRAGGNRESSSSLGLGGTAEGPQPGRRPCEVRGGRGGAGGWGGEKGWEPAEAPAACGGPFCDGWMGTAPVGVHSVMGGWVQHLWGSVL